MAFYSLKVNFITFSDTVKWIFIKYFLLFVKYLTFIQFYGKIVD